MIFWSKVYYCKNFFNFYFQLANQQFLLHHAKGLMWQTWALEKARLVPGSAGLPRADCTGLFRKQARKEERSTFVLTEPENRFSLLLPQPAAPLTDVINQRLRVCETFTNSLLFSNTSALHFKKNPDGRSWGCTHLNVGAPFQGPSLLEAVSGLLSLLLAVLTWDSLFAASRVRLLGW